MKFCMVSTFFPPYHTGGDAVYVARLAEALARRGHQIDVVHDIDAFHASGGGAPNGRYDAPRGVSVYGLTSALGRLSPLLTHQTGRSLLKASLRERLDRGRYDVVHFHNVSLIGLEALSWGGDAVRLLTLHEHWLVCPTSILWRYDREVCTRPTCITCTLHAGRPPQWWRYGSYLRRQLSSLDRVIAPSRAVRDAHAARGLDLPYEILPHFTASTSTVSPPPERPYFLYVGRLIKAKGVQTLFPAFGGSEGPELLVAGDGPYAPVLREMARSLPRVTFLGYRDGDALTALYRQARALIVPSLCEEVFGMVVIEAFAHGTPVIARRRGALAEIVDEAQGGLLFDDDDSLKDAIVRMGSDAALRERAATRARQAFEARWTEGRHLDGYFAIIEQARAARHARPQGAAT